MPDLSEIWNAGVQAVRGKFAVEAALERHDLPAPDLILAVGKAACDMAGPALSAFPHARALVVTKHDHAVPLPGNARVIEAGHPIPDAASLDAGAALQHAVNNAQTGESLLFLVSGGASALAEHLPADMDLDTWQARTSDMIASGADIHEINTARRDVSLIKGGKLLAGFRGASVTTLVISDVEGDDLMAVGSGIGAAPPEPGFEFAAHFVASNAIARGAAARAAVAAGHNVIANDECLYGDVNDLAPRIAERIKAGPAGITIFGGEPTVVLPPSPGRGGRNQALALMLAREIAGVDGIEILVAGTDGTDGPTPDAGAVVTGKTWTSDARHFLDTADAGTFLATRNALVTTGPTGTNVMDLLVARKS